MKKKSVTFISALLFLSPLCVCCEKASLKDEAVIWVQLDITATHEHYFVAGDPGSTVNASSDISFTIYGFYTITRMRLGSGSQYLAFPGRSGSGRFLQHMSLTVIQSHPCQDGESSLIGRETRNIPASIHPGTLGLEVVEAEKDKVRISLNPVTIEFESLECTNPHCVNGFGFEYGDNVVGWDRDSDTEDEYGYEINHGYMLTEIDFQTLKEIGEGSGEIPLTIPISIDKRWEDEQDTPTGPESRVFSFRVNGYIGGAPPDIE